MATIALALVFKFINVSTKEIFTDIKKFRIINWDEFPLNHDIVGL